MTIKHATLSLAALAFAACSTEPAADNANSTDLALEQAAPPGAGGLTLTVDGIMENGEQMTFTVDGAQPGEQIYLTWGRDLLDPATQTPTCPPPLQGLCFDTVNPRLLGIPQNPLTANTSGTATLTLNAPGSGVLRDGFVAWFQAATLGATAATSNAVGKFNPRDTGAVMTIDILEVADVDLTASTYDGTHYEIWYSAFNGIDMCIIESDADGTGLGSIATPCPGCDFGFEVTYSNAIDGSESGDCTYFGFTPLSALAPQGVGYNPSYYFTGYGYYPAMMVYNANTSGQWLTGAVYVASTVTPPTGAGQFQWLVPQINFFYYP